MALLTSAREPRRMTAPLNRSKKPSSTSPLFMAMSAAATVASHGVMCSRPMDSPVWVLALVGPDVEAQVLIDPRLGHADELRQGNLPSDHLYPDQAQVLPLQLFIFPGEHPLQELLPCHAAPHS